jgi:hypothetical protein
VALSYLCQPPSASAVHGGGTPSSHLRFFSRSRAGNRVDAMESIRKQRVPDALCNPHAYRCHPGDLVDMVLRVQPSRHSLATFYNLEIDLRKTRVGPLLSSSRTLVPCAQVCMHITSVQSEQEAAIVRPWQNVQHGVARLECWRLFAEQPTTRNCNRRPWTDRSAEDYTRLDWARLTTTMSGTGQPARNAHLNRYCPGRRGRAFSTSW